MNSSHYDPESGAEAPAAPPNDAGACESGGTLELLLDMELPLMVRFGKTRMLLRDLMALSAGSVIDLAGSAAGGVELLVNGRVIARGSAVTVQGNYGVRISEIADAREGFAVSAALGRHAAPGGKEN